MIYVRIIGGLGNQLFQYAFARYLAEMNNTGVKLDITGFSQYNLHKYSLSAFNIQEIIANEEELKLIQEAKNNPIQKISYKIFKYNIKAKPISYIREISPYSFNDKLIHLNDNIYLDGYWNSEKYFIAIKSIIKREFQVKVQPDDINKKYYDSILSCNSVSIHFRRGDFINNYTHGISDIVFYQRGINYINERIDHPHYFIFSDDPDWCKTNLSFIKPSTFLDINNPDKNYEDLRLMSACKHNIIANSTFSWWGAWLGNNQDKIVICPDIWFNDRLKNRKINFNDLYPASWIKL